MLRHVAQAQIQERQWVHFDDVSADAKMHDELATEGSDDAVMCPEEMPGYRKGTSTAGSTGAYYGYCLDLKAAWKQGTSLKVCNTKLIIPDGGSDADPIQANSLAAMWKLAP